MENDHGKLNIQAENNSIAIGEINISGSVTGDIRIGHTIIQPADDHLRHDLDILRRNVETTWIKGVLENSVYEAALIDLGMELHGEAVESPWHMVMEKPDQSREAIPTGKRIKDVFEESNRLLLILGEPGAGKTTTLLQLARDLLAEVDQAFTQSIPVVFNLSTWTNKQQPLDKWLIAELNSKYFVPRKQGRRWLEERRILPLLDGLDEVKVENRGACVQNINKLVVDYGLRGLVVCSRAKEYNDLPVRLAFYGAVFLQSLTQEQIDKYLSRVGDNLSGLRAALQENTTLRDMAKSPLILSVMSLSYSNTSADDLHNSGLNTSQAGLKQLFTTYIDRMLKRKGDVLEYTHGQIRGYLSWLAWNMQIHNQDVFLIENLQPGYLPRRRWRIVYLLVSRLASMLLFGMIFGLIATLFINVNGMALRVVLGIGFLFGLVYGVPLAAMETLRFEWLDTWQDQQIIANTWWGVLKFAGVWLFTVLIGWLLIRDVRLVSIIGFLLALRSSRKSVMNDIQPVEALRLHWRMAIISGLGTGTVVFLLLVLLRDEPGRASTYGELIWAVLLGTFVAVFYGLRPKIVETKTTANQGIRLSARNAAYGGLAAGLTLGLAGWLVFNLIEDWLTPVLQLVLAGGLLGAFWYGGFEVIHHYILRLLVTMQGHAPGTYARFLDHAVDRIFMQKVGGGYRFIHRLLLEHFADMYQKKS